jgi:hypothetical protein
LIICKVDPIEAFGGAGFAEPNVRDDLKEKARSFPGGILILDYPWFIQVNGVTGVGVDEEPRGVDSVRGA